MADERTLMAVFAHPDDETGTAGTLAMYAAQGVRVFLVCATRGEVGEISNPALATPETLGQVREQELREACRIMGIQEPIFLGYRDSGMAGTPDNQHPQSLHQADPFDVEEKLVRLMRQLRPQVVLTFDPSGIYGHPDHVAIHRHTTEAFHMAGHHESFPYHARQGLVPYAPRYLYYMALPTSRFQRIRQLLAEAGAPEERLARLDGMGVPDEQLTHVIDVSRYVEMKRRERAAHRTQNSPTSSFNSIPRHEWDALWSKEYFIQAFPQPAPGLQEGGLF